MPGGCVLQLLLHSNFHFLYGTFVVSICFHFHCDSDFSLLLSFDFSLGGYRGDFFVT